MKPSEPLNPPISPDALIGVDALLDDEERQIRDAVRRSRQGAHSARILPAGMRMVNCLRASLPSNSASSGCSGCT